MRGMNMTALRIPIAFMAAASLSASLLLVACGSSGTGAQTTVTQTETGSAQPLTEEEVSRWTSGSEDYRGREATVAGKVFNLEHGDNYHVYQINTDVKNYDGNTIIYYEGEDPGINKNDFIKATGIVQERKSYENAFGATMSAPMLKAEKIEVSTYQEIASPTIAAIEPNLAREANGYIVTVQKVEFAKDETRVYVSLANGGAGRLRVYDYSAVIIQDGKQYNTQSNYQAGYPSINNEVAIGATLEGIVCFPALEQRGFQLQLQGSSDNYEADGFGLDFTFDIAV